MRRRRIEFFLPGFLWMPMLMVFRFIRSLPSMPWVIIRKAQSRPVVSGVIGVSLIVGALLTIWGARHLVPTPSSDVAKYNEAVWSAYIFRAANLSAYCGEEPGDACPSQEEVERIVLRGRVRNLEQKDKFAELAVDVKDPRISSRALYNVGTAYLGDAIDFKDIQSLKDSILALQNSLRDDSSYHDSFDKGSRTLVQDKRINLEIALRFREMVKERSGEGDGEEEEGNLPGGFGAGKSNSGRQP